MILSIIYYKVPQNILDGIENDYMDSFRNYIVKLKTHDLNIDSTDNAEKVILQENDLTTISSIKNANAEDGFDYISNAGGAFLEWLEGNQSPGVIALKENKFI